MAKSAKKIIKLIAVIVLAVLVIVALGIRIFGGAAVKKGVVTIAGNTLDVPVKLDKASLSVMQGKVSLKGLEIGNPPGYTVPQLMSLGNVSVDAKMTSLLSDTVEIEQITLDGLEVTIEQKALSNNLQDLLKNLESEQANNESAPSDGPAKELVIRELVITNASFSAKLLPIPGRDEDIKLALPEIKLVDIGKDNMVTVAQLIETVIEAVAGSIITTGGDILPDDLVGGLKGTMEGAGKVIDAGIDVLEKGADSAGDALEKGKDVGKGIGEGIKSLLGGKKDE